MNQQTIVSAYISVKDVAARLGVSKMTIYRMVHSGEIPSIRVGRSFRIPKTAFQAWLEQQRG